MTEKLTEVEYARRIIEKKNKKNKRKEIMTIGGFLFIIILIVFVIMSYLINKLKENTEFSAINTEREATLSEKQILFTYLIEIEEKKVKDVNKFNEIVKNSITTRSNGKVYIATSLTPYNAMETAEKYKTAGIVQADGIKVLAPMLRLQEDKK